MCDCSLHLGDSFLRKVSSSLSFEHDVRTIFLGGTIQEAGAERERERVPDGSNLSSDEEASDDHGSEESDGASEAQSGERLYLIVVMVPTSMFWSSLSLYLYLSLSDYLYLSLWIWIR